MKLYKTTISPTSNFATDLKGDTLFGQMCWAIRYKLGEDKLISLLQDYDINPFLVVSDGMACGYLPKPNMPSSLLNENIDTKKQNRKNIWLTLEQLKKGEYTKAIDNKEAINTEITSAIIHNSINYKTSTTGADGFDPHSQVEYSLSQKDIYFLVDNRFNSKELSDVFELVSQIGYGKDASTGKGRFIFDDLKEVNLDTKSKTFMAISPFIVHGIECEDIYYEPFTRFGKSGASRSNKNSFKKPIVLANSGAVINFRDEKPLQYIGQAIKNISTYEDIVHQGYSILIPIKELENEK